jgi:hypothetical protein
MTVFDLLFIILLCATVCSVSVAAWFALRLQFDRAARILARFVICATGYLGIVVGGSLILPRRVMKLGECQCFDDVCVSVDGFQTMQKGKTIEFRVEARLSSRALAAVQRENKLVIYLADYQGRRYNPVVDSSYTPFNIKLQPQESAVVSRSFRIPENAKGVGAVITHEGGFPIRWFIIGYDTWFRKRPLVPLS